MGDWGTKFIGSGVFTVGHCFIASRPSADKQPIGKAEHHCHDRFGRNECFVSVAFVPSSEALTLSAEA